MKKRLVFCSLTSTIICLIFYQIILKSYFEINVPNVKLLFYVFVPVIFAALILHLYFTILAWSPVEKFLGNYFPDQKDLSNLDILSLWEKHLNDNLKKQDDLDRQINLYLGILNHLEEGILIISQNGKIIFSNLSAEEILHFRGNLTDKQYWEVLQKEEIKKQITDSLDRCIKQTGEYTLHSPMDRSVGYLIIPISELFQSKPEYLLLVLSDLTKLKKLEKVRTDFVANVSHELKSPLGAILGYIETMIDEPLLDPDKKDKYLKVVYKNGIQLNAIIDDLLVLSKIESDRTLELTNFKPGKLLFEIMDLYAEKIEEKKLLMITDSIDSTIDMQADKEKINQLMINMLDNAIKYSKLGGQIDLSLEKKDDYIVFSIKDNGIGIPIMEQERIFERFYRVDKSRSNSSPGTGLGLSIVKHIVDLHQGKINLVSERNVGSIFTITLPINLTQS